MINAPKKVLFEQASYIVEQAAPLLTSEDFYIVQQASSSPSAHQLASSPRAHQLASSPRAQEDWIYSRSLSFSASIFPKCSRRLFLQFKKIVLPLSSPMKKFKKSIVLLSMLSKKFVLVNKGMSIDDFKFIYWMEYVHRMWGRGLGIAFAVPVTYFLVKGYITRQLGLRLSALFALGAGQGLVCWWMVKSGLEEPESEYIQPRVSPHRLAAHLTSAFVIYCGLLWTALSVVMPEPPNGSISWIQAAAKVRKLALLVSILVGITAVSGAFVAGNDAGHAYNTFPKMVDKWIPDDIFDLEPAIRNFFENTSTVQLDHRILATSTLLSISAMWLATRKLDMHPAVRSIIGSTAGMAALQVTLGISTLLSYVPVSLASAHQAGALTLLTLMVLLTHSMRKPSLPLLKSVSSLPKSNR